MLQYLINLSITYTAEVLAVAHFMLGTLSENAPSVGHRDGPLTDTTNQSVWFTLPWLSNLSAVTVVHPLGQGAWSSRAAA